MIHLLITFFKDFILFLPIAIIIYFALIELIILSANYIELRNDPITEEEYKNTKKFNKNLIYKKRLHTNSETIPLSNIDNNNNYVPPVITFQ